MLKEVDHRLRRQLLIPSLRAVFQEKPGASLSDRYFSRRRVCTDGRTLKT